jgi:hypothetical protein
MLIKMRSVNKMALSLCVSSLLIPAASFAADPMGSEELGRAHSPQINAYNQEIFKDCFSDSKVAGCGNEKVGHGLLSCLQAYKAASPSFIFSDSCKKSMQQRQRDNSSR